MYLQHTSMKGKELGNTEGTWGDCSLSRGLGQSARVTVLPRTSEKEEILKKRKTRQK